MKHYNPTQLAREKLLINAPSIQQIYKMLWDGRLEAGKTGTMKRSVWIITDKHIEKYNKQAITGVLPTPKAYARKYKYMRRVPATGMEYSMPPVLEVGDPKPEEISNDPMAPDSVPESNLQPVQEMATTERDLRTPQENQGESPQATL